MLPHILLHFEHTWGLLLLSPLLHRTEPINWSTLPLSLPSLHCLPPLPFAHVPLLSAGSEYYEHPDYQDPCDRDIPMCDLSHVVSRWLAQGWCFFGAEIPDRADAVLTRPLELAEMKRVEVPATDFKSKSY
ncbi:hypothetical protein B0H10DRAFT_1962125 [Mycena sp. CBHHK59/15]|nr:hypothetical protein B0H10DRAFT_1964867 [Mycena sp. CBHHK59/15]KAJ6583637.1 hypothetical protein B0H10DRAFT_1962125 [Mycena sp. CBHHK59/15]